MRWPLRNQIMGPLLAVSLASLATVGAINARLAATSARGRIERQLRDVVGVLTTSNFPLTSAVLRKMRDLSSADFVLTDAAGTTVATSFAEAAPRAPVGAVVGRADEVALGDSFAEGGHEYFHTAVALAARPGDDGSRVLHIFFPRDEYLRTWRQALLPPLIVGVVTIAAAAVVAGILAGRISRATERLGNDVLRLARGDFSPIDLPGTNDEIRDLAAAVNRTASMLAEYEQQVRRTEQMRTVARLGVSLAHEMRNAATGCRMAVDLHAEICPANDDESLAVARRQLRLIESQLQRFLQVGKRPAEVVLRELNLGRIVDELLPLVRPAANHAGVHLDWTPPDEPQIIRGDEDGLSQVALNLILNAIEAVQHQPYNGGAARRVVIELKEAASRHVEFVVSDTGAGPAAVAAPTMFQPFVTSKAEGAGLGLAVAKQIVEAHTGTIDWSRRDGMTCFRVTLPLVLKEAACV